MKIVDIEGKKSSYLLNDLRNVNEIFRKDATYDNIISHKRPSSSLLRVKIIKEKKNV